MRCGCPNCGTYMIQSESLNLGCVCPDCLTRCSACMGTDTVVMRENLSKIVINIDCSDELDDDNEFDSIAGITKPEDYTD